jgi:hypothetical protein
MNEKTLTTAGLMERYPNLKYSAIRMLTIERKIFPSKVANRLRYTESDVQIIEDYLKRNNLLIEST